MGKQMELNIHSIKSHDPLRCGECQRFISKQEEVTEQLRREVNESDRKQIQQGSASLRSGSNGTGNRTRIPITAHRGSLNPPLTQGRGAGATRQAIELGLIVGGVILAVFGVYQVLS